VAHPVVYWKPGFLPYITCIFARPPTGGVRAQSPFPRLLSEQAGFVCGSVLFVGVWHASQL